MGGLIPKGFITVILGGCANTVSVRNVARIHIPRSIKPVLFIIPSLPCLHDAHIIPHPDKISLTSFNCSTNDGKNIDGIGFIRVGIKADESVQQGCLFEALAQAEIQTKLSIFVARSRYGQAFSDIVFNDNDLFLVRGEVP